MKIMLIVLTVSIQKCLDQIEFFVSQNPEVRTLNFPLSLEMNTCIENNNKLYYLLNYNQQEDNRILHLEMVFRFYSRARIAKEIRGETWSSLISSGMDIISNYQTDLGKKSQHIDNWKKYPFLTKSKNSVFHLLFL